MINPILHADDTENPTKEEMSAIDKELRKFVTSVLKEMNSDIFPDVQTYLAKETSPENDSSEKVEESVPGHDALERMSKKKEDECVPEHAAQERRSKKKDDHVVNVDELTFDDEPLTNIVTPSIAKRLQRCKGKAVVFKDSPSREMKRKSIGLKDTPKEKVVSSSDPEFDVEKYVQDITPVNKSDNKKPHAAMPKAPLNNVSLHYVKNAERWKYVIQRRTVTQFGHCYESLVKEFMVTIPDGCDDVNSADYGKVCVRGNVVTFSPAVINKFIGRTKEPKAELEVTDDQVCKEITAKIRTANWVPTNHTSTISTGVRKFIYVVGTRRAFDFGKYIFEQVLKQVFSTAINMPICFPSLICGVILNQHPGILLPIDSVKKRDSPLPLHYKLFAGTHVLDIIITSPQVPGPATSKKSLIAQLKENCKELEDSIRSSSATKIKLETLMKAMMAEEKKEDEQGGDDNEGTDVEDYAGGDDVDEEKEDE
ncbi:uncharacterized protein LOC127130897 [Lathyrus oleraceus]|uniref:uncharacterized protein LOC127130897 n=1 Tax=Pisum sativum TaxID=3888 RepID=UPI0021D2F505|nr:uncharacterized protein LOC127130897 [Pisum sativum]